MNHSSTILQSIGHTPLIRLNKVVPPGHGQILVKLESANPTGSMKDRMALSVIEQAETDGRLKPGWSVVEYTGGSTGTSLALVCATKGYGLNIVTSDAFSLEKRKHMKALGAELTVIPSHGKGITKDLIHAMITSAREISKQSHVFWTDQLNNRDAITGYHALGEELWHQTDGNVDAFVQAIGTAHSLEGTVAGLRSHKTKLYVVAVEPEESAVLSGGKSGTHHIEGIGLGFIPPLWNADTVDEIVSVCTREALSMARRLAREEGIFGGTSCGANVVAAIRVAQRLEPKSIVATLVVDSGLKYLTTDLYAEG